jgi:hypothetical protein
LERPSGSKYSYSVVIDFVSGGEIANLLEGYIQAKNEKVRFKGIAYGRYGGQNVAPRFSNQSKKRLRELFGDLEPFTEDLQSKLVRGEFEVIPKSGQTK